MKIVEILRLLARTRSEYEGASRIGWKNACDYIARELILQQSKPDRHSLETLYLDACKCADSNAKVFVRKERKRHSICRVVGCDQMAAQTSHFCEEHRHTVRDPTA